MTNLGTGVLLGRLFGNEDTIIALTRAKGKEIKAIDCISEGPVQDELILTFDDHQLVLFDDGQSCCEYRYMHTDDDLVAFVGAEFTGAEVRDGPMRNDGGDDHEIQFLLINTSLGTFTVETHNVHNGYYGGFCVVARSREMVT